MRLLLLSNSTNHGAGYLDHAQDAVHELFGSARKRTLRRLAHEYAATVRRLGQAA